MPETAAEAFMPWPVYMGAPDMPELPPEDLPETDGVPLESAWHRDAMNFLIELIRFRFRGRTDFFAGGNMFIHFSAKQARNNDFRGPDVFLVKGIDGSRQRRFWAVWKEEGRYPDLIVELLSPSTAAKDRGEKKAIYEQTFHTPEYFCYDPEDQKLEGWNLRGSKYESMTPNERGWLWSDQLQAWLGTWEGLYHRTAPGVYLRLYDADGHLIPSFDEDSLVHLDIARRQTAEEHQRAESERRRAETERQRAEVAEAELARLKALLAEKGGPAPG